MPNDDGRRGAPARVLWIGGAHADRTRAEPGRFPARHAFLTALARDPNDVWVKPAPAEMAESARRSFVERFEMVLDDLAALPPEPRVLAEGWGLRPELVAPLLDAPQRAVFLVPTEEFREHQLRTVPRAAAFSIPGISDPERAQRNRVERDRLLGQDVLDSARRLGLRVIEVDGTRGIPEVAEMVEEQFRPYLPTWRY